MNSDQTASIEAVFSFKMSNVHQCANDVPFCSVEVWFQTMKVMKKTKIRNPYNQTPDQGHYMGK